MTDAKNNAQENPAIIVPATAVPPAKAVPRKPLAAKPAPAKKAVAAKTATTKVAAKPAGGAAAAPAATVAAAAKAQPRPVRKTAVDATVDKHQKALADALEQAQAIKYDKPKHLKQPAKAAKAEKPAKAEKAPKARKAKLVRDSFAMPESEYARIGELKKRLGGEFKKSELLRAGVAVLAALNDAELKAVMGRVERIKTGRPAKK